MSPPRLALLLGAIAAIFVTAGLAMPVYREAGIVVGLFFALLAGGVMNWDKRGGH